MPIPSPWLVLLPAHRVRAGGPPVPARLQGADLVAWRTAAGALQVWRDRCPHRGVRLSLGRVGADRLACAYHGWEFSAGSGRCLAIPALADLTAVPGDVRAGVCSARERAGMVWVAPAGAEPPAPEPDAGPDDGAAAQFLRTVTLRAPLTALHARLYGLGFAPQAPGVWHGQLAGQALRLFTQDLQPDLAALHAWWFQPPASEGPAEVLAALRQLRTDAERPTRVAAAAAAA